jgi:hypothetical protein
VYLVEDELTGQLSALKHMIMQTKESREATLREIDLHVRSRDLSIKCLAFGPPCRVWDEK